jgi:hypothetical protein
MRKIPPAKTWEFKVGSFVGYGFVVLTCGLLLPKALAIAIQAILVSSFDVLLDVLPRRGTTLASRQGGWSWRRASSRSVGARPDAAGGSTSVVNADAMVP